MLSAQDCQDIPSRLRFARLQAGLEAVAMREELRKRGITLSKGGLHRVENTEPTNPNLKMIEAIAEITGVSASWLLFGKGPALREDDAVDALRQRIIDTIEHMSGALDLTSRQQSTLENWLKSVRTHKARRKRRG